MQANAQPRWYVMRAYKAERKAEAALKQSAIDHYVPKIFALRVYHGVKSRHLVPAIPSMVFVHACYDEILDFKKGSNFVQFVTRRKTDGGGPLVVPDRQMEDFIRSLHGSPDTVRIPDISREHFHMLHDIFRQGIKPAPCIKGIIVSKSPYFISLLDQFFRQMASYETVSARYEYFSHDLSFSIYIYTINSMLHSNDTLNTKVDSMNTNMMADNKIICP